MCGIAGFFGQRPIAPAIMETMLAQLRRRGPDAQHVVTWDSAWHRQDDNAANALIHARLSIIDPRPEADQPMRNDAGDVWICYNGEVYGWQEDARTLAHLGFKLRTHCDTEFILRGYEAWGFEALLPKLRGMFALAILDLRQRTVWLARDRMGLKPLVYYFRDGELAFGSTVRSLIPYLPAERRGLSPEGIDAFLAHRYVPAPRTIFRDIERLENGHWLHFDLDSRRLEKRRYWQPRPMPGDWRATLDESIRLRTVADRPVGLFLSSGIDSSVLACRLSELGYHQLAAFTAAFPGSPMDECPEARAIAARLDLPHHAIEVPPSIAGEFARIVADLDEPFADPSSFPSWFLARETSKQVKVVLGGDGGDELFAGYKRIYKHLKTRWRRGWRLPLPVIATAASKGAAKLGSELRLDWDDAYALRFSGFTPNQRRFLQPGFAPPAPVYWREPDQSSDTALERLLAIDFANYLPEYILRKTDLCTMAHGLEQRAPLLDHHLYQSLLALPHAERFTQPPKQALAPLLAPLADMQPFARKKRGFNPPLESWLRQDLAERFDGIGARLAISTDNQLDRSAVDEMISHYRQGESRLAEQLLQLLILDESLRQLQELTLAA
ncbi:MAG: asparagine synthase (glutamine-hydrolyzing) [Pseudomonadota bacterium]